MLKIVSFHSTDGAIGPSVPVDAEASEAGPRRECRPRKASTRVSGPVWVHV